MIDSFIAWLGTMPAIARMGIFVLLAIGIHALVVLIRKFVLHFLHSSATGRYAKLRTIGTLLASFLVFALYFLVVGLILREMGVSLTAYLASASVVGLAIGFGSQGIVQDVVTGITLIFSDLIDVGDLVEVSGQTGVVQGITMRFVQLRNAMGASVYIPNRTITNVINYPKGYVRCVVDVTLPGDEQSRNQAEQLATGLMQSIYEQYPAIQLTRPSVEGRLGFTSGKEILRLKFRIWPGRGAPIETSYLQELTAALRQLDPNYQPWMISIAYEVEKRRLPARGWG